MNIAIFGYRGLVGQELCKRIYPLMNDKIYVYTMRSTDKLHKKLNRDIGKFRFLICCCTSSLAYQLLKITKKIRWEGYFIDASSLLRYGKTIVLDIINKQKIIQCVKEGQKIFCGGNCTVSILLTALGGIVGKLYIEKLICNTYQAISGCGRVMINNFIKQIRSIVIKEGACEYYIENKPCPRSLCFNISTWIGDKKAEEEEKICKETNSILGSDIRIYSTCVRVNVIRCHSEAVIIKLSKDISLDTFRKMIRKKYTKIVSDTPDDTKRFLNPIYVSKKKYIFVGRIRKLSPGVFSMFIVGDQLLWGAVDPLIRLYYIIRRII
ncbi:Asd/ArgC dimerization domain-containing protein [Candidatus Vidania fulgoroideorum]